MDVDNLKLFKLASILDPRTKNTVHAHDDDILSILKDHIRAHQPKKVIESSKGIFGEKVNIEERVDQVIERFWIDPGIEENEDPLLWWREKEHSFPEIAELAKKILMVPPTSVECERNFSSLGRIVTPLRSSLHPEQVCLLNFVRFNRKVFQ